MKLPPGQVVAVCLSTGGIPRLPVESAQLTVAGFENDGHRYDEHYAKNRAVTLFNQEILDQFVPGAEAFPPGSVGENITVARIDLTALEVGTRLLVGETEIQLEKRWKPCHAKNSSSGYSRVNELEHFGFFASVVRPGTVHPNDRIEVPNASDQ
ncbi:MOSC domain-containing protein [Bremerella alba]|uniref:MOSC domain-containing protein n=1 Tax=Bremerella alba TaxID=980252 RepID=A0A7V9A9S0_9BACT|nr:MOSC domain-containing protein [Bremerella alba]MBA2117767.1 hypothetical protein [Bremerella alba]